MRGTRTALATVLLAGSASFLAVSPHAAFANTTVRDDDGSREDHLDLDYTDDVATKRLTIPAGALPASSVATLYVFGQAEGCGLSGSSQELLANGAPVADFNPCDIWATTSFSYATFDIPVTDLVTGTTPNTFHIGEIAGDWTDRNSLLGIDSNTDHGASDIQQTSSNRTGDIPGELMWYLDIVQDTAAPVSAFTTPNGSVVPLLGLVFGTVTDNHHVASEAVTFTPTTTLLPATTSPAVLSCGPDNPATCSWSVPAPLIPGSYLVTARATDGAGNAEFPGPSIIVTVV